MRRAGSGHARALEQIEQASERLGRAGERLERLVTAYGAALEEEWWRRRFYHQEDLDIDIDR